MSMYTKSNSFCSASSFCPLSWVRSLIIQTNNTLEENRYWLNKNLIISSDYVICLHINHKCHQLSVEHHDGKSQQIRLFLIQLIIDKRLLTFNFYVFLLEIPFVSHIIIVTIHFKWIQNIIFSSIPWYKSLASATKFCQRISKPWSSCDCYCQQTNHCIQVHKLYRSFDRSIV